MDITVKSAKLSGVVSVVDSKSEAHRKLICSLLSFDKTVLSIVVELLRMLIVGISLVHIRL